MIGGLVTDWVTGWVIGWATVWATRWATRSASGSAIGWAFAIAAFSSAAFAQAGGGAASQPPAVSQGGAVAPSSVNIEVVGYSAVRERGGPVQERGGSGAGDEVRRAEIAGRLIHTQVRVQIDQASVAEVLRVFGQTLGVPILPLYRQRAGDPGLDPAERIDLEMEAAPAHRVLDAIAAAAMDGSGTWQVHGGRVEVGPKWLLARASAREAVTLSIRDLLLEPPTTQQFGPDVRAALEARFPEAIMIVGRGERSTPDAIAAELVMEIERQVEPDAWLVDEAQRASLVRSGEIDNPMSRAGQWASMTARDGSLVVTAPDFVLRGIRGYPGAIPPTSGPAGPRASGVAPPEQPVISALGGGRMELLGFAPSAGRSARSASGTSISPEALAAAGRLVHARLDVVLEDTTMRDAVEMLVRTTGADIRPRWASDTEPGIDSASRLTLELRDASGREVLEILLAMANASSECTWQLDGAGIEVGPKIVLARPHARRRATLDVSDLLIEAPYFIGPARAFFAMDGLRSIVTPLERNYGKELGMSRDIRAGGEIRKSQAFIAAELLLLLEKHVEPQGWIPDDAEEARRIERGHRAFEPLRRDGTWISADFQAGTLTISAPDFVLRGVVGYPHLPSPAGGG